MGCFQLKKVRKIFPKDKNPTAFGKVYEQNYKNKNLGKIEFTLK